MTVACGGRLMVSVELTNDTTGETVASYPYVQCNVGNNVSTDEEHFFKGNIIKTYKNVSPGKYTATVQTFYYYTKPGASYGLACENAGSKRTSKTVTVPGATGIIITAPACYGSSGGSGIRPAD